jgi:hypothetical protein
MPDETTTQHDVALDTVAALDMFAGSFGADNVVIESVEHHKGDTVRVALSNGDVYDLRVRKATA